MWCSAGDISPQSWGEAGSPESSYSIWKRAQLLPSWTEVLGQCVQVLQHLREPENSDIFNGKFPYFFQFWQKFKMYHRTNKICFKPSDQVLPEECQSVSWILVWTYNKMWKILIEMGVSAYLTCILRNLYTGQEATVRTGHGTIDWFQIGKGVCQGSILPPCLFKFYAEYIIQCVGQDEAQAESRLLGEIPIISDMQMAPPLWQKAKKN